MRLAQLRTAPELKQPLLDKPAEAEDVPLRGPDGVTPKEFVELLRHDLAEAASIVHNMTEGDTLALAICSVSSKSKVILERFADPESTEVKLALEALELAANAAQLWHTNAWPELARIVVDLKAAEETLDDVLVGGRVPLSSLQRAIDEKRQVIDETKPVLEAHLPAQLQALLAGSKPA